MTEAKNPSGRGVALRTHTSSMARLALVVVLLSLVVPAASTAQGEPIALGTVNLSIYPATKTVIVNELFSLEIRVSAGAQQVDGVDAFLSFNPAHMSVDHITPGATLPSILANTYNNSAGTITYSAGKVLGSTSPSGTFTLATIYFKAKTVPVTNSPVAFQSGTDVAFGGVSVLGTLTNGAVTIRYGTANLLIWPTSKTVALGEVFSVDVQVQSGTQPVDGVDAYLTFNRSHLAVHHIVAGTALPTILANTYNNSAGTITFSAGKALGGTSPNGTFRLCTIYFTALSLATNSPVNFVGPTDAAFAGASILGTLTNGRITIQTPTPTPSPTPTATPVLAHICAFVYEDQNRNGVRDPGEPLLPGAVLTLSEFGGPVLGTYTTDGVSEPYCFHVPAGLYELREQNPSGYDSSTPDQWGVYVLEETTVTIPFGDYVSAVTPTPTPTSTPSPTHTPTPTPSATPSITPSPTPTGTPEYRGVIDGVVWEDTNRNAAYDWDEAGLGGVTVDLYRDTDGSGTLTTADIFLASTTTTKPNGFFAFANLPDGNYLVQVSDRHHVLTGYRRTTPLDPVPVTLTAAHPMATARFGYAPRLPYGLYLPVVMKE